MAAPTAVQFLKYPLSPHWYFESSLLGEDDHGVWLGAPPQTPARRGSEPWTSFDAAFVMLIPRDRWWTMVVNAAPQDPEIYVDVCTTARWVADNRVEMIDLDLDVIRMRDGSVHLLDEEEFLDHSVRFSYPPHVVAGARTTAAELMLAVEQRVEPFGSAADRWFAALADRS